MKLLNALLKLNLVRILGDLLVLWHQVVLQLTLDKELQRLNEVLIQLFLLLLFLGHLRRRLAEDWLRLDRLLRVAFFILAFVLLGSLPLR